LQNGSVGSNIIGTLRIVSHFKNHFVIIDAHHQWHAINLQKATILRTVSNKFIRFQFGEKIKSEYGCDDDD